MTAPGVTMDQVKEEYAEHPEVSFWEHLANLIDLFIVKQESTSETEEE